ncbi:hypothetical protein [Sphingomonas sp. ID0503]|uniref:hypothetical protein n=1 Tax=Sphingomonas sp. ID0503 TaxID=3399691 RepID=UPI003AFA5070
MPLRNKGWAAGLVLALLGGGIAVAQSAPESLLPPGFGNTPAAPAPVQPAGPAPTPLLPPASTPDPLAAFDTGEDNSVVAEEDPAELAEKELPSFARRDVSTVGFLTPDQGGYAEGAFGTTDGRYLATLLHRLNAPLPSRWGSILLRRALTSRVGAPAGVPAADWVAERAWTLLRMGEADAARMLVQGVDGDRYSPWLVSVAKQTALATGDPSALCPIAQAGLSAAPKDKSWRLVQAICAALSGEGGTATAMIERVRQGSGRDIDLLLAEKVAGAGIGGRRSISIDWAGVDRLTAWRFGLANATGVAIPADLYPTAGGQVRAWAARAPMMTVRQRIPFARTAAALGVFSNAALVDLYANDAAETDAMDIEGSTAQTLRQAYVAADAGDRLTAIKAIWAKASSPQDRYAAAILTARAAARIAPSEDHDDDAAALIAAMFSAGLDIPAARWASVVTASGDDAAWALLAVGAERPVVDSSTGRVEDYVDNAGDEGRHRAALLVAALAGLGRLPVAEVQRFDTIGPIVARNRWTDAIDLAAARGQPGTVAILAATGLQGRSWASIPAGHLYHIVAALRRTGQEGAARMIAAEAVARS